MNTALRIVERDETPKTYSDYMADYMAKHEATNNAWIAEVQAAQALYESGTWKETGAKNWNEFCHDYMPYKADTYRVKAMDAAIAEMIMTTVADATPSETESRKVRESLNKLTKDKVLKAETYARAHEATGKVAPSFGELKIAYEEIQRVRQDKVWTIEGEDLDPDSLVIDANIQQGIYELYKRKTAHIQDSMGIETRRAEIPVIDLVLGALQAVGQTPANNPRNFRIIWDEDKQS